MLHLEQFIVGFCGKIYPIIVLEHSESIICHNLEQIDRFVEQNFKKKAVEEYKMHTPVTKKRWSIHWNTSLRRKEFQKFFDKCEKKQDAFLEIFREKRCPVFVAQYKQGKNGSKITYNACLKNLDFYRIFDTFTAFQEIAMFLGGLAVPLKPIPNVPDRVMVEAKGFDKYSFRKEKSEST